ncbi:MAG TPA: hypothetical protein VJC17_03800 [Candidatus Dojkabacteria bacterium]|nr:hypothetical protein [Candidatus Dojkabacteria bacterium]
MASDIFEKVTQAVGNDQLNVVVLGNRCSSHQLDPDGLTGVKPSEGIIVRALGAAFMVGKLVNWRSLLRGSNDLHDLGINVFLSGGATNRKFPDVTEAQVLLALMRERSPGLFNPDVGLPLSMTSENVRSVESAAGELRRQLTGVAGNTILMTERYFLDRAMHRMSWIGEGLIGVPANPFFYEWIPILPEVYHGHSRERLISRNIRPPLPEFLLEAVVGRALNRVDFLHHISSVAGEWLRKKIF